MQTNAIAGGPASDALDAFCVTLREAVTVRGIDGLPEVERALSQLLLDPAFVAAAFDEAAPVAKKQLAHEPVTGAYVLAHMHAPGREGAPHTHGDSWAVYGTARGATVMTEWRDVDDGNADGRALTASERYTLAPGETRAYHSGKIHSTQHPVPTWVIRVTGANLDAVERYRFDPKRDRIVPAAT
jgi:hypothetical protein